MKRLLAFVLLIATLALAMVGCNNGNQNNNNPPQVDPNAKSEGTMTYQQYAAAAMNDAVVIEGFVQAKQSWWDNKATVYLQDGTGAYLVYEMTCTEEQYNKLVNGTKIKVIGFKTEYKGEIEVDSGATFEIIPGDTWIAPITDVTALLGKDEIIEKQNMFVCFKGMTVKAITFKGNEPGDDIYVALTKDGADYSFCVERYLTAPDTEVYKAVSALTAGQVIDVEGFLYWYDDPTVEGDGINTHITAITVK